MSNLPFDSDAPTLGPTPQPWKGEAPTRVGPYRILREIGEGGMGVVYEAEQDKPVRRKVALKLIKWGMDTREVIARFETERQALALMNHPSIARVYDAGATAEGRPYFAMEYVQGIPITEYCDKYRLPLHERLRLFIEVCEGVQHAHQKGIIHRDIKPTNVLVTSQEERAAPKIIDFGVAKATSQRITENTVFTELGQVIGTPEYMSPEQAEMSNLDIDTRTDVYSLGALLYELLAGRQPFDPDELRRAGLAEIQRRLREEDPPRPSSRVSHLGAASTISATNRGTDARTLGRALEGDLDWITMKALEKDRARRYSTPHDLALDIQRHLRDEPVLAGPPGGFYRARKLYRRHRGRVLAATAVLLALVLGIVGTSWALLRATRAERKAATEAAEARRQSAIADAVVAFLNQDLLAAAAPSATRGLGSNVTMREVLKIAAERIDAAAKPGGRFASEPLVEASVRLSLGYAYRELGEYPAAAPHLERAYDLRRAALGDMHPDTVRALGELVLLRWRAGKVDEAETLGKKALDLAKAVFGPDDRMTLAFEMNLASIYRSMGRYQLSEPLAAHNLETKLRTLGADHLETLDAMGNLANYYQETGHYDKAEALHRRALEVKTRLYGEKAPNAVMELNNLANDIALQERYEEAAPLMQKALLMKQEIYGPDHPSTLNSTANLAELDDILGRDAEAEALNRDTYERRLRVLGPQHFRTLDSKQRVAESLLKLGRVADAEPLAVSAAADALKYLGDEHLVTLGAQDVLARVLVARGRAVEAEALLRRQLAVLDRKKAAGQERGESEVDRDTMHVTLAMALAAQKRRPEAEALLLDAVPKLPAREADTARAVRFVVDFYERWNREKPDPARAARLAEWKQRLEQRQQPPVASRP